MQAFAFAFALFCVVCTHAVLRFVVGVFLPVLTARQEMVTRRYIYIYIYRTYRSFVSECVLCTCLVGRVPLKYVGQMPICFDMNFPKFPREPQQLAITRFGLHGRSGKETSQNAAPLLQIVAMESILSRWTPEQHVKPWACRRHRTCQLVAAPFM